MKRQNAVLSALCCILIPLDVFATEEPPKEPRPSLIARSLHHFFHDDETPNGGGGVHWGPIAPRAVILSSGGGPGAAVHFWLPDMRNTALDLHASAAVSIYGYQYYDLQFGLLPHERARLPRFETSTNALFPLSEIEKTASAPGFNVYASAKYRDYPREDYYGLGPDSRHEDHTDYRLRDGLYEGVMRLRVARLSLMGRAGILRTTLLPGGDPADPNTDTVFNEGTAPGLLRAPDFNLFSAGAWLELRDEPLNPHQGAALGVVRARYDDRNGNLYAFDRTTLDAREYIAIFSRRHVLALRQAASFDDADPGNEVPFYLRSSLGGGGLLRSYASFRFRDDRLIYVSSEYRFELQPKVELALLYEGGKVYPDGQSFNLRNLRRAYGVGLRLKSPRRVHLRLDVMHGDEGTRAHLKLGPSF
jgi:outer membrane protein assembly factor BamA